MEAADLEALLDKVGGKYKLVTLYQRRMRELQRGLPRLADVDSQNIWDIVSTEILQSKVDLLMGEEAEQMRKDLALREAEEPDKGKAAAKPAEEAKPAQA